LDGRIHRNAVQISNRRPPATAKASSASTPVYAAKRPLGRPRMPVRNAFDIQKPIHSTLTAVGTR
jgi:hypothetical protein